MDSIYIRKITYLWCRVYIQLQMQLLCCSVICQFVFIPVAIRTAFREGSQLVNLEMILNLMK